MPGTRPLSPVLVVFGPTVAVNTTDAKLRRVLSCQRELTPGDVAGGCHERLTGSTTWAPGGGPNGDGGAGTLNGGEIVGLQPERDTSTDTEPSKRVATQLGSLKALAEMEKSPLASACPVG